jgi:hypothetical protein
MIPKPIISAAGRVLIIWVVWMFGGAFVYYLINEEWTYSTCLYYAANTGYSIGYGALYEYNELSLVWSLIMIILGASVIGAAIGYFAANAIDSAGSFSPSEEEEGSEYDSEAGGIYRERLLKLWTSAQNFYARRHLLVKIFTLLFLWIIIGTVRNLMLHFFPTLK